MAITTDDSIVKFGTQDTVTTGTPASVGDTSFVIADQAGTLAWTNDDDAEFAAAVLKCQFATMPTAGAIDLFAHLLDVQSTNDTGAPDANYPEVLCGTFAIDFGVSNATDMYLAIPLFRIPMVTTSQRIDWYIRNNGTSQSISSGWALYITPKTIGPHA